MYAKPTAIILCDYWHPYMSANSACVQAILSDLSVFYDVVVVASDEPAEKVSGVGYLTVGDIGIRSALKRVNGSRCLTGFMKLSYKPIAAMNICRFPVRSLKWAHRYVNKADAIFKSNDVALILAVSYPAEAVLAAEILKRLHPEVTAIGWFLDATAVGVLQKGNLAKRISSSSAVRYEMNAGKELDGMIYLTSALPLVKRIHGEGNSKLAFADPPLLRDRKIRHSWNPSVGKPISVLYAGTLYDPDRNPVRFIEGMRQHCQNNKVVISFAGDDGGLLDNLVVTVPNVHKLGMLPPNQCDAEIDRADILLSIGNRSPYLIPSKLFRYMATGKPIIHLVRSEEDSCLPYLKKYPLALILREDLADVNEEFSSFVQKLEADNDITIDLKSIYPAAFPDYTVGLIQALHEKCLQEKVI